MFFKQFYLGCLSQASYLIGDGGEAAVIDPLRDVDQYIDAAQAQGLAIKYVIETHLHADFVSGHRELAERTGAKIFLGRQAQASFEFEPLTDGDELAVGQVKLRVLETPGHTPEHISILVTDPAAGDVPQKLLTGDTLFIGDVGRPDLVVARGRSAEEMAGLLYDSITQKILPLPDAVEICPGHGAGSLCGRYMSEATTGSLGEQRAQNPMLQPMSRAEFIARAIADQPESPAYFQHDVKMNMAGAPPMASLPEPTALSPDEVAARVVGESGAANAGAVWVIDCRDSWDFGEGHIPGALNIGLDGRFAMWAGALVPAESPIVLVAAGPAKMAEAVTRLARVGLHNVVGFLSGGMDAWTQSGREAVSVPQLIADEFAERQGEFQVMDVRRRAEFDAGFIAGSTNVPLADLDAAHLADFDAAKPVAVVCSSGYRSSAAISLLLRAGFREVANLVGGTAAWADFDFPLVTADAATT